MNDNTEALPPLPERDTSKPAEQQGLFRKFIVTRTDGSSEPGGKHEHCEYFVLDVDHDPHAPAALAAYADKCQATHPELAADMRRRYGLAQRQQVPEARMRETLEFIAQHFSSDWPERCQSHVLAARHCLTAAPSAQAEPVRQLHSFSSIDCEKLIAATVPGGSLCDPQEVADSIRRYLDAWPSAQAEPNADLRADFERECADTDKLLTALGLSPEHCRTDGGSLKLGMILEALEARDRLIRREAAQAEPQMVAPQDGMQFWLWKNGDHFLAFTHLYPCFTPGGDPMVLGEPVGRAVFRRSFHRSGRGNAIGPAQPELSKARSLTDELMDCVDRLGSEAKDVDPRVWDHLRVYMPAPQAAQAEPQVPLPFNSAQRRRLWDNSPEIHADAKSYAAFERIVQLVESAHGIGKQEG